MYALSVEIDECDACPAIAHVKSYVFVQMPSGRTVSYCCHHGSVYFDALALQADTLIDLRYTLSE